MISVVRVFFLFVLQLMVYAAIGQTEQKQLFFKDPRAGAFTIFGDIPVSHTTGVPDISIPLFTLESHGYKIPITLKYHLSLVKPPYDYTNVATGWVLETGGTITQEFKTHDDLRGQQPTVLRTDLSPYTTVPADQTYLNQVFLKQIDCEHDIFNYSFVGKSGKFVIDKSGTSGVWDVKSLTASHLKGNINTTSLATPPYYTFQNIQLTDDQGYKYLFQDKEGTLNSSSYFLNEIKTSNDVPLYTYEYSNFSSTGIYFSMQNILIFDDESYPHYATLACSAQGNLDGIYSETSSFTNISYDAGKTVKKISFPEGSLEFTLSSNNRHINELVLKDADGSIVKIVSFDIGTFPGQGYRYLNKVYIKDKNQQTVETYNLNYNGSNIGVNNNSLWVDYWGYLCDYGQTNSWGYIPMEAFNVDIINRQLINDQTTTEALINPYSFTAARGLGSRQPNVNMASIYTLNSIQYPTGGTSVFTYGLNQYSESAITKTAGGLRVEAITNYAEPNKIAWKKRYEYTPGEIDFSYVNTYETTVYNYSHIMTCQGDYIGLVRTRTFPYRKTPAVSDNRVRYRQVTEYWENGAEDNGKTVFDYNYYHLNMYDPVNNYYYASSLQDHISSGLLDKKTVYKRSAAVYSKVSEETNTYSTYQMEAIKNLFIDSRNTYSSNVGSGGMGFDLFYTYASPSIWDIPGFRPFYYDIVVGTYQLTQKTTIDYTGTGNLTTIHNFDYADGLDKYITSESIIGSDLVTKKTSYKYAYSSGYASVFPYNQMVTKNIIADPVELTKQKISGGITGLLSTVKFSYNQFGTNIFRPETMQEARGAGALFTRYRYNYEPTLGKLTSTKKDLGVETSYFYNSNKTVPIAQVVNAKPSDIFHTSFEYGDGNSVDGDAKTGRKSRTNGYNVSLSGLTNGSYILSYWQKSGGAWLYQQTAVNVANGTHNISITGQVDEVRFYPSTAQMSTYTYSPLVGVTSQCDHNNNASYYEYDAFGRLSLVRDKDNNIIKKLCYNYSGQLVGCDQ